MGSALEALGNGTKWGIGLNVKQGTPDDDGKMDGLKRITANAIRQLEEWLAKNDPEATVHPGSSEPTVISYVIVRTRPEVMALLESERPDFFVGAEEITGRIRLAF